MAPIVAPCLQVSIKSVTFGHNVANVLHLQELGATPPDPETAAVAVLDAWCDEIMPVLSSGVTATSADYADLSSLSGISGNVVPTGGAQAGGASGTAVPPNVAMLVTHSALGTRAQRNGRTYLCGVPEEATTSDGLVTLSYKGDVQAAWNDFADALQAADLGLVVLSKSGPDAGDVRTVTSSSAQQLLATQRRRLRP